MGKRRKALGDVEKAIGHVFGDTRLLDRALTHSSVSSSSVTDLERLEFLGDRVLGLLTAEALWRRYPDLPEGEMAPRLNKLVRKETCADAARFFDLGPAVLMSAGEENNGGRDRDAILGDAMEALLGALYVDGGLDAAAAVYGRFWGVRFDELAADHLDPKTALQEWAQGHGHGTPTYVDVARRGPDHAPVFTVEVRAGKLPVAEAEGASKREAQAEAARKVLIREGVWSDG